MTPDSTLKPSAGLASPQPRPGLAPSAHGRRTMTLRDFRTITRTELLAELPEWYELPDAYTSWDDVPNADLIEMLRETEDDDDAS